jgi:hypothetical protein
MSTQEFINISLTEEQLSTIISGLLFSSSVSVVSNVNEQFHTELFELARQLKELKPDIKLDNIQFVKEDNYEDELSNLILQEFHTNMQLVSFEQV